MLRRPPRALAAGLLAAAIAGGVGLAGWLDRFEHDLVDARYELRGTRGAPPDVVVVGIDGATYARLGLSWPFPRWLHAEAIHALLGAGARTVVYDVQFSEPRNRRHDQELLAAAADERVLLGTTELDSDGDPAVLGGARRLEERGGRVGMALFPLDADGVWRRVEGSVHGVPHLSVLAAGGDPGAEARPIDFAGPPGTVRDVSFWRVASDRFDPAVVRDRIAVVGLTEPADQDVHPTAAGGGLMAGAEIHANAIQTVLDGYPLRDAPPWVAVLLVLAAGLLAPLATVRGAPERAIGWALGAGALGAALLLGGAQLAFEGGTIVPVAAPLLALALGTAGAVALTYGIEVRRRRALRTTFERFVAPEVAAELLPRDGAAPRLESRRIEATVLFCDLRGFTTLAERLDAEQTIAVLNRYLETVSSAVFGHGGTVVSYQGDGVLAVFGAPLAQHDHAARALAAARQILDEGLPGLNAWLREERLTAEPLDAGIGVNTGFVMSGIVGSRRRVEYAAVGDATNVAARLQGLGRDVPGRLFVSGTTVAALGEGGENELRLHGQVSLRGRREPVTVYTAD